MLKDALHNMSSKALEPRMLDTGFPASGKIRESQGEIYFSGTKDALHNMSSKALEPRMLDTI